MLSLVGANAKLRYQITSGNVEGVFDVETEAGTVFIVQPLDYEQEQRYELQLVASDGKWENHTLIIINVVNKNDEAPVFTQNEYYGSVLEELTDLPAFVLKVKCFSCSRAKPDFFFLFFSPRIEPFTHTKWLIPIHAHKSKETVSSEQVSPGIRI